VAPRPGSSCKKDGAKMSLDSKIITVFYTIVHPNQNLFVFHSALLALGLLPNCWYFANRFFFLQVGIRYKGVDYNEAVTTVSY